MVIPHWLEVRVFHSVFGSDSLTMVIAEHLAQQVEGLLADETSVLRVHELRPGLAGERLLGQKVRVVRVKRQPVLFEVGIELLSTKHFCDLDQLVIVVAALEEWLALKDHTCEHTAE